MTWFKVDDKLASHPKVMRAGLEAMGLWVLAGSECAAHLLDGRVSRELVRRLAGAKAERLAARLVEVGLWQADADGWTFHEWAEYQPTREKVLAERARNTKAGRRGGLLSGASRRVENEAECFGDTEAEAKRGASEKTNSRPVPSRPVPSEGESERPPEDGLESVTHVRALRPQAMPVPIPDDFAVTSEVRDYAKMHGLADPDAELLGFVNHQLKHGTLAVDWNAAFRKWLAGAQRFNRGPGPPPAPSPKSPQSVVFRTPKRSA